MIQRVMLNNLRLEDVNPLVCGRQKCPPGHQWGPAIRDFYLLHYVFEGKGIYTSPRGEYQLEAGQIFVIFPGETVSYTADPDAPWSYGWVGFTCGFSLSHLLRSDVIPAPECVHLFHALADAGQVEYGREWYICGKIYELLALLAATASPRHTSAAQYVQIAQNYIESHYSEPIRIEQIARYLNLNRSYFSKIFRTHTGKSPQEYLVHLRLRKAAELLTTRPISPGDAGRLVGYADTFNFSRMFRRVYGVSPSRYRRQQDESDRA